LVLEAMGEAAATTSAALTEVRSAVNLLHGRLAVNDTTQQSLVVQLGIITESVNERSLQNAEAARQFTVIEQRLEETSATLARLHERSLSPDEDHADPKSDTISRKGTLRTTHATWSGNTTGAGTSSVAHASDSPSGDGDGLLGGNRGTGGSGLGDDGAGGSGGAGGGGLGGAGFQGGDRTQAGNDNSSRIPLKMSFPRFDGEQPRIWNDKCLDYFRLFNVNPALWLVSATLHMEGNATLWLKAYRLRHDITTWPQLMLAVEEKFGADDHRKYMKQLLALKQRETME
jgi:hypothetical protein